MARHRMWTLGAIGLAAAGVAGVAGWAWTAPNPANGLTNAEIKLILDQAEASANLEDSALRPNPDTTRMHIMIVDRTGKVVGQRSMADAWYGSIAIAKSKAFTAMAFSSDRNALTTRTIGALTQPGGALWNIGNSNRSELGLIEFPGGMPLYKNGVLVGGIGVSGDGVEQDENVAEAGSIGFHAPVGIRNAPYTNP